MPDESSKNKTLVVTLADTAGSQPPRVPDYDLLRRIGGGGYGAVWLAKSADVQTFFALRWFGGIVLKTLTRLIASFADCKDQRRFREAIRAWWTFSMWESRGVFLLRRWVRASTDQVLRARDRVSTGPESRVTSKSSDQSVTTFGAQTMLELIGQRRLRVQTPGDGKGITG